MLNPKRRSRNVHYWIFLSFNLIAFYSLSYKYTSRSLGKFIIITEHFLSLSTVSPWLSAIPQQGNDFSSWILIDINVFSSRKSSIEIKLWNYRRVKNTFATMETLSEEMSFIWCLHSAIFACLFMWMEGRRDKECTHVIFLNSWGDGNFFCNGIEQGYKW